MESVPLPTVGMEPRAQVCQASALFLSSIPSPFIAFLKHLCQNRYLACLCCIEQKTEVEGVEDPVPKAVQPAMVALQLWLILRHVHLQCRADVIAPPSRKQKLLGAGAGESSAIQSAFGEQPEHWVLQEMQSWRAAQPASSLSEETNRPTSGRGLDDDRLGGYVSLCMTAGGICL